MFGLQIAIAFANLFREKTLVEKAKPIRSVALPKHQALFCASQEKQKRSTLATLCGGDKLRSEVWLRGTKGARNRNRKVALTCARRISARSCFKLAHRCYSLRRPSAHKLHPFRPCMPSSPLAESFHTTRRRQLLSLARSCACVCVSVVHASISRPLPPQRQLKKRGKRRVGALQRGRGRQERGKAKASSSVFSVQACRRQGSVESRDMPIIFVVSIRELTSRVA